LELSVYNASAYLGYPCSATLLGGGVSNTVLLIESPDRRFVLKQSLGKLRVEQDWFSDRSRIFRESSAMRQLARVLPAGAVPDILFEDHDNYLFAMTAAPPDAEPWKDLLLRGQVHPGTAESIGHLWGTMVSSTWKSADAEAEFGDQTIFNELRLDPYYRSTAARHPDLAAWFQQLIAASQSRRYSLVHGDWSPKNFLVRGVAVMAIDFEVIHFGDPSFDAAFLLNHLLLKSFYRPRHSEELEAAALRFWKVALDAIPQPNDWFEPATIQHLGALLLARIDGKSPAEYIRAEALKTEIRSFARRLILDPPKHIADYWPRSITA
jgi:5-methylthioribose kinase